VQVPALLEEHQLGEQILGQVNRHLQARGVRITTGTIVDATILHAPTSTKNREQRRDPEMHQTKKGKQWYFGMKAHMGVDSKTKIIQRTDRSDPGVRASGPGLHSSALPLQGWY
jgi:IS5 family transposase